MSLSSAYNNRFAQSFDESIDVKDLRKQNQRLIQENMALKQSLEQLIQINNELTTSIQEFNNAQNNQQPHINQEQIEQLAHRVIQLEQQLQNQRNKQKIAAPDTNVQQTLKVIQQLASSFQTMQEEYQGEIQRLQKQLINQKGQCQFVLSSTQSKFHKVLGDYQSLLNQLKKKDETIQVLQKQLSQFNSYKGKKQMKISTTIEQLRITLQKQIQQKTLQLQDLNKNQLIELKQMLRTTQKKKDKFY